MTNNIEQINIMIVDDHTLVREGLIQYLSRYPEFVICGEAGSGKDAVNQVVDMDPDIVLLDMFLPDLEGVDVVHKLLNKKPNLKILILTAFSSEELVKDAIQAGASGFVYKDILHKELATAIHQIVDGEIYLAQKAMSFLIESSKSDSKSDSSLTYREKQILQMIAQGRTNSQIAITLSISCSTVDFHVRNILTKLNVSNRTEAVVKALKENKIKIIA